MFSFFQSCPASFSRVTSSPDFLPAWKLFLNLSSKSFKFFNHRKSLILENNIRGEAYQVRNRFQAWINLKLKYGKPTEWICMYLDMWKVNMIAFFFFKVSAFHMRISVVSFKVVTYIGNATSPKVIWNSSWDFLWCSFINIFFCTTTSIFNCDLVF